MSLRDIELPIVIDTSSADLFKDFFVPALAHAARYDRGVGYFSSGWMRMASKGMVQFAANGGRARWVTSPILDESDWNALMTGNQARSDPVLHALLIQNLDELEDALEMDTLSALAWMVADEILEFKIALPYNKLEQGDFHDKFGVFADEEGNRVSFNGSYNDSIQGTRNYESIKIFCSWEPAFATLVKTDVERFERLWNNLDPNVQVFDLPSAAKAQILRLRSNERPYPKPSWIGKLKVGEEGYIYQTLIPKIPNDIKLRDYQLDAINAWFDSQCQGLMEMATGTGKTITSLACAVKLFESSKRLALVITCPYQHLVDQWFSEAKNFGFTPIKAYKSRDTWLDNISNKVMFYNHYDLDHICIITTHETFSKQHFQEEIRKIDEPKMIIADEVHHLGSSSRRNTLPSEFINRLALSATPDRWFDDVGTDYIRKYFGVTVFKLSLADAIGVSLTPYYYYPVLVELNEEEISEYKALSLKIGKILGRSKTSDIHSNEYLSMLLIKRADILNKAANKLSVISELVDQQEEISKTLFYCAPNQIDDVMRLLGWEKKIRIHRFTAREDIKTRQDLLNRFSSGNLQALAAMHCLDEGVDVPSTTTAYILASSSNPREFIQRRGRVLRKFPGKTSADIYDLITIPPPISELDDDSIKAEQSILRRELKRFVEFADSSRNTQSAYDVIWDLAEQFQVLDALNDEGVN